MSLLSIIPLLLTVSSPVLFDAVKDVGVNSWFIVDDGVMGGLSQGKFFIQEDGPAVFTGSVSLENNGGFSSVHLRMPARDVHEYQKVRIHLKGDGKRYQFRLKTNETDSQSYIAYFETSGEWEVVELELSSFYPSFRGEKLDMPNFPGEQIEEIAFLIANYKAEDFRLEFKRIELL